jgi:hypothetical protein
MISDENQFKQITQFDVLHVSKITLVKSCAVYTGVVVSIRQAKRYFAKCEQQITLSINHYE